MQVNSQPRILTICGSLGEPSCTEALAGAANKILAAKGASVEMWSLRARPLPFLDPAYHHNPERHPAAEVREFVAKAGAADALVLASPDYHNSYSGVLKNALDHLNMDQLREKPVGLMSHGGGRSTQPVDHLRIVVRGLLGVAITTQVCTAAEDYSRAWNGARRLTSDEIERRIGRFADELIKYAAICGAVRQEGACT